MLSHLKSKLLLHQHRKLETFENKTAKNNIILKSDLKIFVKFNLTISVSVKLIEELMHLLPSYALALFLKYKTLLHTCKYSCISRTP